MVTNTSKVITYFTMKEQNPLYVKHRIAAKKNNPEYLRGL